MTLNTRWLIIPFMQKMRYSLGDSIEAVITLKVQVMLVEMILPIYFNIIALQYYFNKHNTQVEYSK